MSYVSNTIIASMISCRYMRAEAQRKKKKILLSVILCKVIYHLSNPPFVYSSHFNRHYSYSFTFKLGLFVFYHFEKYNDRLYER